MLGVSGGAVFRGGALGIAIFGGGGGTMDGTARVDAGESAWVSALAVSATVAVVAACGGAAAGPVSGPEFSVSGSFGASGAAAPEGGSATGRDDCISRSGDGGGAILGAGGATTGTGGTILGGGFTTGMAATAALSGRLVKFRLCDAGVSFAFSVADFAISRLAGGKFGAMKRDLGMVAGGCFSGVRSPVV